jgi:predicted acylesterase/phospholipase RssA
VTLSGGASLGAYEAGAAAALALAARYLDSEEGHETTFDAIGGASAGALVSFFTAHALLEGLDPETLLHETWVERVSLPLLRASDSNALLSFDELRERVPEVLGPERSARAQDGFAYRQPRSLALHVQLTGLRGLTYPIQGLRRDAPVTGVTYADWGRFALEPGGGLEQMLEPAGRSPLDFAVASAASPGGFAPELLDRRPDAEIYKRRGIENFPESGHLWYTDGGLLASRPLGRLIAAGEELHGVDDDPQRLHLLIDPRSENASLERWSDPDAEPSWQTGASRALAILSEQSLFDDLRRVEEENSRIEWADRLAELLAGGLDDDAAAALRNFIAEVRDDGRADGGDTDEVGDDVTGLLRQALREVGGLVGKARISNDVISPLVLAESHQDDVGAMLAGEFLGDFGGFLSRELRASDFALGYQSTIAWLDQALPACGVGAGNARRAVRFVESRRRYDVEEVRGGEARLSDLSLADRFELVRLGAHVARVLGAGVFDVRSRIPDAVGRAIQRARDRLPGGAG